MVRNPSVNFILCESCGKSVPTFAERKPETMCLRCQRILAGGVALLARQTKKSERFPVNAVRTGYAAMHMARLRARELGLPFDLTPGYVRNLYETTRVCPALGVPLAHTKLGSNRDFAPSLDRVVPDRGYVMGNVVVISTLANRIKNSANATQIRAVADWLDRWHDDRREFVTTIKFIT